MGLRTQDIGHRTLGLPAFCSEVLHISFFSKLVLDFILISTQFYYFSYILVQTLCQHNWIYRYCVQTFYIYLFFLKIRFRLCLNIFGFTGVLFGGFTYIFFLVHHTNEHYFTFLSFIIPFT